VTPSQHRLRYARALGAFLCLALACGRAGAAEIALEASAVDKLVKQALFGDGGRYYLKKGACYAYLEQPTTTLKDGRIWIRAHLTSKLGLENGADCYGPGYATWIVSSGRPSASGSTVSLDDLRIDNVDDPTAQAVLEGILLPALPKAFDLDLKPTTQRLLTDVAPGIQSNVDSVTVRSVSVVEDKRLAIAFDFKLSAK